MILRKKPAESTVHNYLGFGIKGKELDDKLFARPHVNIIETDADDASKIEYGVDEGHTGSSTMEVGRYIKSRSAAPTWTQQLIFSAGLEEVIYCALPNHNVQEMSVTKDGKNLKYYKHTFDLSPIHFDQYGNEEVTNVPLATIYMGMDDPIVCNNAELCELSFESNSEDSPTLTPTFNSDYPNFDTINILKMYRTLIRSRTAPSNSVRVFIGKTDAESIDQMTEIEGYQSASFDFKDGGLTGSIKFSRTDIIQNHKTRQLWYLVEFGDIPYLDYSAGEPKMYYTGVKRRCLFKFPIVEFFDTDAMNITTAKWTSVSPEGNNIMQCEILSELPDIQLDDEGVSLQQLV